MKDFDASGNVSGVPPFRQTVPNVSRKRAELANYWHEFNIFANPEGLDWVFVMANDSSSDVDRDDPGLTVSIWEELTKRT